jgi:hypothetical protein
MSTDASSPEKFAITFRPAEADFTAMMNEHWGITPGRVLRVRILKAIVVVCGLLTAYFAWKTRDPVGIGLAVMLVLMLPAVSFINKTAYARAFKSQRLGESDATVTIDDFGITSDSPVSQQRFPWSSVQKISVTDTHAFAWIHRYLAIMMPAAAFSDRATFDRAIDFCKARVQGGPL